MIPLLMAVVMVPFVIPSIKYKRLTLLVATLRLPKQYLEDFIIMQKQNAAMQIFDVPITVDLIVWIIQFFFIQAIVLGLAVAGG